MKTTPSGLIPGGSCREVTQPVTTPPIPRASNPAQRYALLQAAATIWTSDVIKTQTQALDIAEMMLEEIEKRGY